MDTLPHVAWCTVASVAGVTNVHFEKCVTNVHFHPVSAKTVILVPAQAPLANLNTVALMLKLLSQQ